MKTNQAQSITPEALRAKGWTYAAAARRLGRTTTHVYLVVTGKRHSAELTEKLLALPTGNFEKRERLKR